MRNIRIIFLFIGGACILFLHSCNTCSRPQTIEEVTIDLADLSIDSSFLNMAQKVFYNLPSPIEMTILMKNLGVTFQPSLLHDPSNASKYLTNQKMALNFGAYIADLTYAGLFEQSQTVLRYKLAVRILMEGLGLMSTIDINAMQQLEDNINNKDEVLRIISDTYASCTAALNENDRYFLTLAVFIGGWVEAIYIATSITTLHDNRTKQLMIDQKLTFDMLWQIMSEMNYIPEVAGMMDDLSELAHSLDKLDIENITSEEYVKIKEQIRIFRQNFTQK